jgi:hypothetical protein
MSQLMQDVVTGLLEPAIFFCVEFLAFWEKMIWEMNILSQNSLFFKNISPKIAKSLPKFSATAACNLKGCLRFFYFHILNVIRFG